MIQAMVVIEFGYACSQEELEAMALDFAQNVKPTVKGLVWKIFLNRPESRRTGGLYLFESLQTAQEYSEGEFVRGLRQTPGVTDFSATVFSVMGQPSALAGAPLEAGTT
jgi:hypothetical protein